jgi:hypothetical protein
MMLNQDLDCRPDGGEWFHQTPPYSLGILPSRVGRKDGEPNMKLLGSLSSLEMQPAAGHHHFPSQAQVRNYSVCSPCLLKNHPIYSSSGTLLASLQSFAFRILLTTLPFVSTVNTHSWVVYRLPLSPCLALKLLHGRSQATSASKLPSHGLYCFR